jgi:hypothetical protein
LTQSSVASTRAAMSVSVLGFVLFGFSWILAVASIVTGVIGCCARCNCKPVDGDEETGDMKPVVVGADGAPAKRYAGTGRAAACCPDGACHPWCHDRANHVKMSYAPLLLLPAGGLMAIGIVLAFSGP